MDEEWPQALSEELDEEWVEWEALEVKRVDGEMMECMEENLWMYEIQIWNFVSECSVQKWHSKDFLKYRKKQKLRGEKITWVGKFQMIWNL